MIVLVLLTSRRTLVSADFSCNAPLRQLQLSPRKFKFSSKFSFPIILYPKACSVLCPWQILSCLALIWLECPWKDNFLSSSSQSHCPFPWFLALPPPPLLSHQTLYYCAYLHFQASTFAIIISQALLAFALTGHLAPALPLHFKPSTKQLCACCLNTLSPNHPQSYLDVVPQILPSIAVSSTKNLDN